MIHSRCERAPPQPSPTIPTCSRRCCSPSGPRASGCARSSRNCSVIASGAGPRACPRSSCSSGWRRPSRSRPPARPRPRRTIRPSARQRAARRRANRGALPAHLPRIETVVDVDSTSARAARGPLHRIGEDVAERLDIVPAQFRVLVVRRPKYACRACEDVVVQAPAPARLIEGGLPTEATVAQVLVSKYADHLPLYRQAQIYARQGVKLDRSTLADWVGRAAFLLRPVHERLLDKLQGLGASCSPTRRRHRCSIPGAAGPRPASSSPMRATTDRGAAPIRRSSPTSTRRIARRSGRSRISPASAASCRSTATPATRCWPSRARCGSPSAGAMCVGSFTSWPGLAWRRSPAEALTRIAALYRIEDEIRGRSAEERRAVRQQRSRPLVEALAAVAAREAVADQPEDQARRGDPLRPVALDRALPVPRRRPGRDRQQRRRARHPPAWHSIARTLCSPAPTAAPSTGP